MPKTVSIRTDYSASELRRLAAGSKDANQSRRLLSLAAVLDGMGRADAARMGGMDRQTLRDWEKRAGTVELRIAKLREGSYFRNRPVKEPFGFPALA
jgi:hypothetical protein